MYFELDKYKEKVGTEFNSIFQIELNLVERGCTEAPGEIRESENSGNETELEAFD